MTKKHCPHTGIMKRYVEYFRDLHPIFSFVPSFPHSKHSARLEVDERQDLLNLQNEGTK